MSQSLKNETALDAANSPFAAMDRLYGKDSEARLKNSSCMVIGLGGIGSWTAEALARSGVGKLVLVDMDDICHSNINRQIHTLKTTVGKLKVDASAERIQAINPACNVHVIPKFFTDRNAEELFDMKCDFMIDAIDSSSMKCLFIDLAKKNNQKVLISGGAGGRRDPTQIVIGDITRSVNDPLLKKVRKMLRQKHDFPRNAKKKWGIPCVYTTELIHYPDEQGCISTNKPELMASTRLDCWTGIGSVCHVTASFGFAAASAAIQQILNEK